MAVSLVALALFGRRSIINMEVGMDSYANCVLCSHDVHVRAFFFLALKIIAVECFRCSRNVHTFSVGESSNLLQA